MSGRGACGGMDLLFVYLFVEVVGGGDDDDDGIMGGNVIGWLLLGMF